MTTPSTCHIMLDLESLGVRPGSVVLSAAFVRFEDHASVTANLSIPDQQVLYLEIDPNTRQWWGTQPPEAWQAATSNAHPLQTVLPHFAAWIAWVASGRPIRLWCHGAAFDAPLLQEVYRRAGIALPWSFRDVRDTRTLYDLAGIDLRDFSNGQDHIALGDALAQTHAAQAALTRLAGVMAVAA